ncbi:MAG: PTS galactitol transporter subunit IIC [Coriobacteriaceae bacterium]|uniref:PTS galactitol transporter subunit IIC n=1 Tax=Tractidigestivibacter sp. TaxID=2847320 RepID=UPI002A80EDD5|nr:PTS transporter subunit IIC [Tractidigestivibacter sp.]MCI6274453.1 PTS galactitol transporter subunit IIC [Coriobacteriaceae bacterium]MCI6548594.1 PTS galactitol transporter subunit IIC [Coriobacteriaceae bacterium]MCI6843693.1 PTS galactitol transporter subunit IIC [Coriobacteriaceae bacterium]MCI7439536.1 PTS galactitol transporter subunit IIC [Coriobacteriaceae bacterium]MDD7584646.1 PTS galactitol transporter subunit IIC [Coriobacteriaceae bacterium]
MDFSQASAWIQEFLNSVGAAVFVPVIMIIMGLVVRMKPKDAISSGILLGVAFSGMSMLINYMSGLIQPVGEAMLNRIGIDLPIMDGGWTTMAAIAWSWPFAILVFPLMIGINIIMLMANKTETFNADLWNVWGKIFTAIGVVGITGSVPLAFIIAAIQIVFELKTADLFKDEINELTGIPGVTCTHKMVFLSAIFYPIDKVLRKIPALNHKADAAALKEKVGIFAENHVLGFIIGCLFGILGGYDIPAILTLGVQAAMCLTLFPVISKYFMEALSPISEAVSDYMHAKFSNRQLVVGLDWPFLGGSNEIWLTVIYAIPITVLFSFILPGNQILPFAGIVNIAVAVPAYLVTRGNLPRMLILATIGVPIFLYVGTAFAPFVSDLARQTGAVDLAANALISCSCIDGPVFTFAFAEFLDILNGNFLPLVVLVIWIAGFFYTYRDLKKQAKLAKSPADVE